MKTGRAGRPLAGLVRRGIAVGAAVSVAGCGMFSPFHHSPVLRQPQPRPQAAPSNEASPALQADRREAKSESPLSATLAGGPPGMTMAGGVLEALQEADLRRRELHDNLAGSSRWRHGAVLGANVLTGWGLYNALKPVAGAASGATATDGDKRRTVRIGATLATLYGLSQFFVNDELEKTHIDGYEALTCLMLQSRPFLMTAPLTPGRSLQAGEPTNPDADGLPTDIKERLRYLSQPLLTDYERLSLSLRWLEESILELNQFVANASVALDPLLASESAPAKALRDELVQARRALGLARNALRDGYKLKATIDRAGAMISQRTALIVAGMNGRAQEAQKDIAKGETLLGEAATLTDAFVKLGIETATDEKTGDGEAGEPSGAAKLLGLPLSFGGALSAMASAAAWLQGAAGSPAAMAGQQAGAAAAQAPARRAAPKPRPPAETPVTRVELNQRIEEVMDLIADPEKQKKRREQAEVDAKIKAAVEKATQERDTKIKQLQNALADKKESQFCSPAKDCERKVIQEKVENLFALRRPVVQAVLNFRELGQQVRTVGACSASASGLRVSPADDRLAQPGDTLEFLVAQRDKGNPMVGLQGDAGLPPDKALVVTTLGDALKATVTVGKEAPRGALTLVVTDSKGRDTERVFIFVKPKRP